ncbi:coiled-coil domain containing 88A [Engraulis encrasicolus]|uniref:coiled-coil domain containing 88A n=1 Tax=Engraulis encrasicolus TaxID=184585 RepID=UPI002FCFBBB9
MEAHFTETLEDFMESALVTWVRLFEDMVDGESTDPSSHQYMEVNSSSQNAMKVYKRLTNGIYLNEVMRIIDPNPKVEQLYRNVNDDKILRVQNFSVLNRHLRSYYQENLQQLILMPLPNIAILGQDPLTEGAVEELRRLLLLLLGCAVQCERKETFIQQIQSLDIETQTAIAMCIQEVTQDPRAVLPLEYAELCGLQMEEVQALFSVMAKQIQGLLSQRDTHLERIAELCAERESSECLSAPPAGYGANDPPEGLAVQLADCKAKLRRLKQELEDKGDQLLDYKQEIQTVEGQLKKLQQENRTLAGEARGSRALCDELDCLRDRAAKADQLQTELQSCTHRLRSLDLYRTQLKEQQQYCTTLQENKALLEEQLSDARARCSALRELERDNFVLRQKLMDLEGERDTERQRVDELLEMNMGLQSELRQSRSSTPAVTHHFLQSEIESDYEDLPPEQDLKPLSVEVGEASTLRLLGAENENAELRRRLELLQAEREGSAEDTKEELERQLEQLRSLQEEHQNTLREFQNMKNENTSLRKSLEQLRTNKELIDTLEEETTSPEWRKGGTRRGEGEGKDMRKEEKLRGVEGEEEEENRTKEVIRATREEGEGEEVLHHQKKERKKTEDEEAMEVKSKDRGEAEGEKKMERRKESAPTCQQAVEEEEREMTEDKTPKPETAVEEEQVMDPTPIVDTSLLAAQLQEAQEEADRQTAVAQDLRSKLGEQSKKAWEAEQRLVVLEAQTQRLRKSADMLADARKQNEALQGESLQMEEELTRLRSQLEVHKMEAAVIAQLEAERASLERERETLRASLETLRTAARKGDQLELTNQTQKAELERLTRTLDSARRREEELETELRESGQEAESMARGRDQALLDATRLEQEKEALQAQLDSQRREQRQREREAARLRQQLESTSSALEHSSQRACSLEAEHRRVCQELSHLKELSTKLQDLERELQSLTLQNTDGKDQIASLKQELANEKIHSQELANQVAELTQKLEQSEASLKMATTSAQNQIDSLTEELANEKIRSQKLTNQATELSQKLEQSEASLKLAVSSAQKKQQSETQQQQQPVTGEGKPTAQGVETAAVGKVLEPNAPPQAQAAPQSEAQQGPSQGGQPAVLSIPVVESHQTSRDSESPGGRASRDHSPSSSAEQNERLIDVERENASLQKEREALQAQLSQCQASCTGLRDQLDTLQRHAISLQDACAKLQTLNTKLQVDQATLSTQHASVQARCGESEARCAALEAESKVWVKERAELTLRAEALRRDHERLMALQQRQEVELEELMAKHSQLKSSSRAQEAQFKELEASHQELLERKRHLERGEEEVQREREQMQRSAQEQMEKECELERLRTDNDRFQTQQREWVQVQSELLAQGSVLRADMNAAQLERTRLEGEMSTLREQNQNLDLNYARLQNQYQLLTALKGNMEEENRHLVEQNQSLSRENRSLMERSLENREEHHSQQREYLDKLNELRREKQKLVEKIMDQYRVLEPAGATPTKAKKSNWIADRMKKLIKPRTGRDGRAHFIACGSIENLADATDIIHHSPSPPLPPDPRSAPGSPTPLRRVSSADSEDPPRPGQRSGRRKLGSRHGWNLGRGGRGAGGAGGAGVSQSFSPGDQRPHPRERWHTSQALWETQDSSPSQDSLSEEGKGESEDSLSRDETPDRQRLSSGAEDTVASSTEKSLD